MFHFHLSVCAWALVFLSEWVKLAPGSWLLSAGKSLQVDEGGSVSGAAVQLSLNHPMGAGNFCEMGGQRGPTSPAPP